MLGRCLERHFYARNRHVGSGSDVLLDQQRVVERVDLVARENEHMLWHGRFDEVEVLIECVDGACVPTLAVALLRGPNLDVLVDLTVQEPPAAVHVADQGLRLVLRQHRDPAQLRVHAVREREVDRSIAAAERDSGLRLTLGQSAEPASRAAREHERHCLVRPVTSALIETG